MSSVVAPAMLWYHVCKKISTRSSVFSWIALTCLIILICFIMLSMSQLRSYGGIQYFNIQRYGISESRILFQSILDNPVTTAKEEKRRLLLIAVVSAAKNEALRNAIRATWGHPLTQLSENVVIRYFLGQRSDEWSSRNDSYKFEDEIVLPVEDNYFTLASKSKLVLDWLSTEIATTVPSDYVMKVDDDTFLNLPALASYFRNIKEHSETNASSFYCFLHVNATPQRDNFSQWFVDERTFNYTHYPDYCSGSAYVFPRKLSKKLLLEVSTLIRKFDKKEYEMPEDVLVTGIAARNLNISHIDLRPMFESFYIEKMKNSDELLQWLCRRASEGALALHPLKQSHSQTAPSSIMGALLVASLTGSYHDCLSLASSPLSSFHNTGDDPLGILMIKEASFDS